MAKLKFPDRGPNDLSDETFDFTEFLETGVIQDASVTVVSGGDDLVLNGNLVAAKTVTTMMSGGTLGQTYTLACAITLADGRRFTRSAAVAVKAL